MEKGENPMPNERGQKDYLCVGCHLLTKCRWWELLGYPEKLVVLPPIPLPMRLHFFSLFFLEIIFCLIISHSIPLMLSLTLKHTCGLSEKVYWTLNPMFTLNLWTSQIAMKDLPSSMVILFFSVHNVAWKLSYMPVSFP